MVGRRGLALTRQNHVGFGASAGSVLLRVADNSTRSRFLLSAGLLTAVVMGSGMLFWSLEGTHYSLFESIYFALITISTVGYSELPRMDLMPMARVLVMVMIVMGVATVAFFQSSLTSMMVEGVIGKALRRRRMERGISSLKGHTIVAGAGRTGRFVIDELYSSQLPFVVIDHDQQLLEQMSAEHGGKLLYVVGDATDDHILKEAGVERASGLVTALTSDPENVFVTISTRSLNPSIRVVSKVVTFGA